jgi:hypothetical protein
VWSYVLLLHSNEFNNWRWIVLIDMSTLKREECRKWKQTLDYHQVWLFFLPRLLQSLNRIINISIASRSGRLFSVKKPTHWLGPRSDLHAVAMLNRNAFLNCSQNFHWSYLSYLNYSQQQYSLWSSTGTLTACTKMHSLLSSESDVNGNGRAHPKTNHNTDLCLSGTISGICGECGSGISRRKNCLL